MKPCAARTLRTLVLAASMLPVPSVCPLLGQAAAGGERESQAQPAAVQTPAPGASPNEGIAQKPKRPPESKHPPAKRRARPKRRARRGSTRQASGKVVVPNGGAREHVAQLTPGISQEQARRQRQNTTELMARTDSNLKQVAGRDLTPAEQSMVDQIRTYLRQAKAANESGDVSRAHTLAHKAQLLSSELARK